MKSKWLVLLAAAFLSVQIGAEAQITNRWAHGLPGKWELATNWTINVAPTNTSFVFITNAMTKTVTINAATALSNVLNNCMVISNLTLSAPAGSTNLLLLSDSGTNTHLRIGNTLTITSGGSLVISNGVVRSDSVAAFANDGQLFLNSSDAWLVVTNKNTSVGATGVGEMTVSNGTVLGKVLFVANGAGSRGTVTIAGGITRLLDVLFVANSPNTTGAVWVTGGQLIATNFSTSIGGVGVGQMTVSNGVVSLQALTVGNSSGSQGTLTIAGGTNTVTSTFVVANSLSATGTVWLTGGRLNVPNSTSFIGQFGAGRFTLSNGTWAARDVYIGGSGSGARGTLTIVGGTNTLSLVMVLGFVGGSTGDVWVTGGRLDVPFSTAIGAAGVGQMTVSNGVVNTRTATVGAAGAGSQGTFTIAGGAASVFTNLIIGAEDCSSTGRVIVAGGSLFVTNSTGSAVLDVFSGTLQLNAGTLTIDRLVITNACGHFVRTGGTLIYGTAVLNPGDDTDGDGIPNSWEQQFGLDPLDSTGDDGASGDPDGDGLTNAEEFALGTNPTVSDFRVTAIAREGNDIRITWTTFGGKTNRVVVSAGAAGGSFTNKFTNLSPIIVIAGTGAASTNYLDAGGAINTPSRYYRVRQGLETGGARFLFDANHGQSAGNADWVIDADLHNLAWNSSGTFTLSGSDSNAQRTPTPPASGIAPGTNETYWAGALSAWAVDLVKRGHSVETLPAGTTLTWNTANSQDLTNYDVVVIDEPNTVFALSEKQALLSFVTNGGSLFMICDHVVSDRNGDGHDSVDIWNDFLTNNAVANNPFGIIFRSTGTGSNSSGSNTFSRSIVGNPILNGPVGVATNMQYFNGDEFQIDTTKNPTVISHMWFGTLGDSNNFCGLASLQYGNGRVVVVGDSSPIEDGTGDPGDSLFNGYTLDAGGVQHIWILNASEWLAAPFP